MENLMKKISQKRNRFSWLASELIYKFSKDEKTIDGDYITYGFEKLKESIELKESCQMFRLLIFYASRLKNWEYMEYISEKLFKISTQNEKYSRLLCSVAKYIQHLEFQDFENFSFSREEEGYFDFFYLKAIANNNISLFNFCLNHISIQNEFDSIFVFLNGKVKDNKSIEPHRKIFLLIVIIK
jgi:hypothetical protein